MAVQGGLKALCGDTTMLPVMATSKKVVGHISTGLRRGPQSGPSTSSLPRCITGGLHVHAWWHTVSQSSGNAPGLPLQGHYMADGVFRATLQASPRCVHTVSSAHQQGWVGGNPYEM